MAEPKKIICLFDVDGTLTAPRKVITPDMKKYILKEVKKYSTIGLVGGSDESKISEQMGGDEIINEFDFVFSENGLVAKKNGVEIERTAVRCDALQQIWLLEFRVYNRLILKHRNYSLIEIVETILSHMGEEKLQTFINYALKCLSELTLPAKRGTFIEFRTGLINVCPVGRSCSQRERDEFGEYDKVHGVREMLVKRFQTQFPDFGLKYVIGGQISIDVFPEGWDKTYCLKFVTGFDEIHFFGDKTQPGGNDHEIHKDPRTVGHAVLHPDDTKKQLEALIRSL